MRQGSVMHSSAPALADRTAMHPGMSGSPQTFPAVYVQGKKEIELRQEQRKAAS